MTHGTANEIRIQSILSRNSGNNSGRFPPSGPGPDIMSDSDLARVCRKYEDCIGPIPASVAHQIKALVYDGGIPPDWIIEAMDIASSHNRRSWSYVQVIVRDWFFNERW